MTPLTSVLIVDDEPAVRDITSRWVASLGLSVKTAASADEALATLRTAHCDLVVIDVMMPGHDGLWLARELRRQHPHTALVLATAYTSLLEDDDRTAPLVADLLIKPFARERLALAVDRGLQWRKQSLDEVSWHARLSFELSDRTENICAELEAQASGAADEADVLAAMAAARMPHTMAHGERTSRYAVSVAREFALDGPATRVVEIAGRFHDIGKLAIPESLLNKPSTLTSGEEAIVRRHVDAGAEILASSRSMHDVAPTVLATHEWFGGAGYPLRLAGAAIPLAGRIIAVADTYDAITQHRHYRSRLDSGEAVAELMRCSGTQFDPDVVDAFLAVLGRH